MTGARLQAITKHYPERRRCAARLRRSPSATASSWCWSAPPAAASRPRCASSPGSRRPAAARSAIGDRDVTDVPPRDATSRWCFRATRCIRTRPCAKTSASGCACAASRAPRSSGASREIADELALERAARAAPRAAVGRPAPARRARAGAGARARSCSCSTSRCPTSTPSCGCRCAPSSRACTSPSASTTLYVTHDQEEAMTLGHRIAVLSAGGRIEQVGTPERGVRPAGEPRSSPTSSARPASTGSTANS